MLIECEKCHTTYVLDDKLIPPQGAPVQCTRCGHVFTARAEPAMPSTPIQAPPQTSKTVMFGVPGADGPVPSQNLANAPANRTMMFGGPNNEPPPASAAANKTVMFGVGGADAPAPAPPPGAVAANKTVMFGAPGSAAPPPGAGSQQPTNRTMMFGAPGAEAAAGNAQPTNRTMMFGAPGAAGPVPDTPSSQAPTQAANKTMMFGAGGTEAPPAQANPRSTMMFGAVPPPNLGSTPPQSPQGRPATSQTMMFGAPAAVQQPPAQPPPAQSPQKATSQTMMFGAPTNLPPPADGPGPGAQKSSSTMIFGATPVTAPGPGKAPKLTESTVRIGPEDLERMMREHEALRGEGGMTPPESSPAVSPAQDRQNKTQLFAMADPKPEGATPPAGSDAVAKGQKTAMFAMSDLPPEPGSKSGRVRQTRPAGSAEGNRETQPAPRVDPSILDTFPPDGQPRRDKGDPEGVHTLLTPGTGPAPAAAPKDRPPSVTLQNPAHDPNATVIGDAPPIERPVELPPEDLMQAVQPAGASQPTQPVSPTDADPAAVLRAQVARRNRIALIFIALILIAAALGVTWKVFGKMLLHRAPPVEAVAGCEQALALLRYDDSKSKEAAATQLSALVQKYPDFVEGHAALVTAVSLQLDDVQQRVRRIEQLVDRKNTLIKRYGTEKSPANWEALATQLTGQVEELIKEHRPLAELGHDLDTRARAAYKGLELAVARVGDPTRPAKLAALRAQALFHGVSGTDQALKLTDRFELEAKGSPPDGWIELAVPEYAANARVSPELMQQSLAKLDELHKRDSTFLRTYVLSARLHLINKDLDAATADLDQVLSMRKEHDVALELREWVRKLPKTDDKDKGKKDPE